MPSADIIPITSRRTLLRLAVAAPATAATPATHESTGMLALCAAFQSLEQQKRQLYDTIEDNEITPYVRRFETLQEPLVYRIAQIRAETLMHHKARVRALAVFSDELFLENINSTLWDERLTAAILRDLAD